jgi:hypothetical protein
MNPFPHTGSPSECPAWIDWQLRKPTLREIALAVEIDFDLAS